MPELLMGWDGLILAWLSPGWGPSTARVPKSDFSIEVTHGHWGWAGPWSVGGQK